MKPVSSNGSFKNTNQVEKRASGLRGRSVSPVSVSDSAGGKKKKPEPSMQEQHQQSAASSLTLIGLDVVLME